MTKSSTIVILVFISPAVQEQNGSKIPFIFSVEMIDDCICLASSKYSKCAFKKKKSLTEQFPVKNYTTHNPKRASNQRGCCYHGNRKSGKRTQQWTPTPTKHCEWSNESISLHFQQLTFMNMIDNFAVNIWYLTLK